MKEVAIRNNSVHFSGTSQLLADVVATVENLKKETNGTTINNLQTTDLSTHF